MALIILSLGWNQMFSDKKKIYFLLNLFIYNLTLISGMVKLDEYTTDCADLCKNLNKFALIS